MPSRKHVHHLPDANGRNEPSVLLCRIRNMWQFANFCQWIYIFGKAVKIDESIDIEELEAECLNPQSELLSDIALSLLKLVSSHRGLTLDTFNDQLRKQYVARAPEQNPLGDENNPVTFAALDIIKKIQVLQTLTQWIMSYPERIRDKMIEQKDIEQTDWRIEPYGWDSHDRVYYVLDDNRVYRFTEPPTVIPYSTPKTTKQYQRGRRASQRHRAASSSEAISERSANERSVPLLEVDNGLGGGIWECVAITLQEVREFVETLLKTRDDNEKILRKRLEKHLLPILEKQEEMMQRKQVQRERELLNLSKLANAKRSSRIADKMERQKQDEENKEQHRQQLQAEQVGRREKHTQMKAEQEREFRAFSRQRRLKEREARRRHHEEELAQLSEGSKTAPEAVRISERQMQTEFEKNRQALKDIEQEEEDWVFDCKCGLYGQIDDGTHSVACERCNVWQHSKCMGISEKAAEQPEFHFICQACQRREDEQSQTPKTIIKLKVRPFTATASVLQSKKQTPSSPGLGEAEPLLAQDSSTKD
ncbi:hypothetical protein C2857_000848 [Epichloe festucae Fl1]|uniref:Zinc finger PHD-type domain-containing protein n=1 Tax=Epichloe festucae (strain Fl1) TaxID=877507 RepID=A0A7S9KRD3_EPIFF|nr:hypothetical protein C2857_000848 [Epichloe festucae Fl1]